MRYRLRKAVLMGMLIAGLVVPVFFPGPAAAQIDKTTWSKPQVPVSRPAAPRRKVPRREPQAPLLTMQWRVQKRLKGGMPQDTSPRAVFYPGDQVRLGITPNQDGYLYIILNTQGRDGRLIFPDSRINNGENKVVKNREYVVPLYCPGLAEQEGRPQDAKDCWWTMDENPGLEEFTMIFSRDAATGLPADILGAGGTIRNADILKLRADADDKDIKETSFPQGIGSGRYVIWVQNTNSKENEKLIFTIPLAHAER